jgi:hypothetical protein
MVARKFLVFQKFEGKLNYMSLNFMVKFIVLLLTDSSFKSLNLLQIFDLIIRVTSKKFPVKCSVVLCNIKTTCAIFLISYHIFSLVALMALNSDIPKCYSQSRVRRLWIFSTTL